MKQGGNGEREGEREGGRGGQSRTAQAVAALKKFDALEDAKWTIENNYWIFLYFLWMYWSCSLLFALSVGREGEPPLVSPLGFAGQLLLWVGIGYGCLFRADDLKVHI